MEGFKLRIKEMRKIKGLSQEQLAKLAGISQSFLSEIEGETHKATLSLLWRIAAALEECPLSLIECEICSEECPIKKPGC